MLIFYKYLTVEESCFFNNMYITTKNGSDSKKTFIYYRYDTKGASEKAFSLGEGGSALAGRMRGSHISPNYVTQDVYRDGGRAVDSLLNCSAGKVSPSSVAV